MRSFLRKTAENSRATSQTLQAAVSTVNGNVKVHENKVRKRLWMMMIFETDARRKVFLCVFSVASNRSSCLKAFYIVKTLQ